MTGVSTVGQVHLFFFFLFSFSFFFLSSSFLFFLAPGLNGWIVENCTGLQVVEQLTGPSQGPAVTKDADLKNCPET